ncbi:MAG: four helix bundle protein [Candidatus Marinimicrobia bacterium]|nr:four helix bundle protein [Candidatus Neomarinimicrobiota bacterium]MBL7046999.1 four helix bundle protein [Candidatus Neomarinimicrobiota bacterium]
MVLQIREEGSAYDINLLERTFEFAVDIILLLKTVSYKKENDVVRYQLAKSGTSVGANYEESQATNSRADFRHKIGIALKEARESNYWLRIMERTKIGNQQEVKRLVKESGEIKAILATIFNKVSD